MAAVHPIEVLEKRLRNLVKRYESERSDAVDHVTEKFSGEIERLIEQFGAEELELNLKYYPLAVLPRNLHEAFAPVSALRGQDAE
ncbi:MAG: hypothetical protein WA477_13930 [Candidatus Sulfotelmatobacter sp.]